MGKLILVENANPQELITLMDSGIFPIKAVPQSSKTVKVTT